VVPDFGVEFSLLMMAFISELSLAHMIPEW
jgi:hypothetical protein